MKRLGSVSQPSTVYSVNLEKVYFFLFFADSQAPFSMRRIRRYLISRVTVQGNGLSLGLQAH